MPIDMPTDTPRPADTQHLLPATATRIRDASPDTANRAIRQQTVDRLARAAAQPATIGHDIAALDREWDVERALMANAATLATAGALLALTVNPRFAVVPAVVGGFLLQHALQGWCPPLPVIRALGFRAAREIAAERAALQALRGDFAGLDRQDRPRARARNALSAAEGAA